MNMNRDEKAELFLLYNRLIKECFTGKDLYIANRSKDIPAIVKSLADGIILFLTNIQNTKINYSYAAKTLYSEFSEFSKFHTLSQDTETQSRISLTLQALDNYLKPYADQKNAENLLQTFYASLKPLLPKLKELRNKSPGLCLLNLFFVQLGDDKTYCFSSRFQNTKKQIQASFNAIYDVYEELDTNKEKIIKKHGYIYSSIFTLFESIAVILKTKGHISEKDRTITLDKSESLLDELSNENVDDFFLLDNENDLMSRLKI